MDLVATVALVARHAWLEERLFEVLGAWIPSTADPQVKRLVATECHHHAWRAEQLGTLLPEPWQTVPDSLRPAEPADLAPFVAALAALDGDVERVAVLAEVVLPGLAGAYDAHLARTTEAADGPLARVLRLVRFDTAGDAEAAAALLARRCADPANRARAERAVADLAPLLPAAAAG